MNALKSIVAATLCASALTAPAFAQDVVVKGETVYTMAGAPIANGVVVIEDGKIVAVGPEASTEVPEGYEQLSARVVTPGLVDAHTVVGLTGYSNQPDEQDFLEESTPIQPELRAIDAYNPGERLVEWVRGFGVTTLHTGHGTGALVSGQTMVVKTTGLTVDDAMVKPRAMVAGNIGPGALGSGGKSPGTRSKQIAMLREALIKAQAPADKEGKAKRDLTNEVLRDVVAGQLPLMITANRAQDIMGALRLKEEFGLDLVIDGAAEAYLLLDELREAGVSVILHPTMTRQYGDYANASFTTARTLREAGIPFALQSGYEAYVPKTRLVLWEAGFAVANGLAAEDALRTITIDAARIIGMDDRVGSLEPGKDGDVALFDGDPFEYTTHATAVVIDGEVVSRKAY
ncbi:amidohydrolase family protein [Pseudoblastomonas halimionae]|uniref:Amidohydrolase family protein n=1 Tax=Alteriqipengyuania halimionae TaxID=1926630 RepID=A0A6I4U336_9SPHN|nr:amidohydrolase family protein [Alteriqipengyuania halimionae]MXP09363.1 amidohydrolase family protein [Alteriqipengyuania halimionae]